MYDSISGFRDEFKTISHTLSIFKKEGPMGWMKEHFSASTTSSELDRTLVSTLSTGPPATSGDRQEKSPQQAKEIPSPSASLAQPDMLGMLTSHRPAPHPFLIISEDDGNDHELP